MTVKLLSMEHGPNFKSAVPSPWGIPFPYVQATREDFVLLYIVQQMHPTWFENYVAGTVKVVSTSKKSFAADSTPCYTCVEVMLPSLGSTNTHKKNITEKYAKIKSKLTLKFSVALHV